MNRNLRKGGSSLLTPRGTVAQNPALIPGRVGEPRHKFRRSGALPAVEALTRAAGVPAKGRRTLQWATPSAFGPGVF